MEFIISTTQLSITVDSRLYSEEVIFKSMYWLLNDCSIMVTRAEGSDYRIVIEKRKECSHELDFESILERLKESLIDFKTREIINKETKTIRELLIAKAFATSDEYDEEPPGEIQDTVGINMAEYR